MKQKYISPNLCLIDCETESILVLSTENVPMKPTEPAVPASLEDDPKSGAEHWEYKW